MAPDESDTTQPAATEPLPCPFCGHQTPGAGEYGTRHVPWQIYCMDADCTAEMTAETYPEAVALWNRRVQP